MQQRIGVVNMHLKVDMSEENKMTMLYKVDNGYVQEQHYGLALARVVDLPPQVLEVAERVSRGLEAQAEAKRHSTKAQALTKRRKLVLAVRDSLTQAATGPMEEKTLLSWVARLQDEFIRRMDAIDNDVASSDVESEMIAGDNESIQMEDSENQGEGEAKGSLQ